MAESLRTMQNIFRDCNFTVCNDINVTQFKLTERLPVTLMNDFYMSIPEDLKIYCGAVAILSKNKPNEVAAVGYLQLYKGDTHIILQSENIAYDIFRDKTAFYIALFPQSAKDQLETEIVYVLCV